MSESFAEKFPYQAETIQQHPSAMELVRKAARAGVEFGGYTEDNYHVVRSAQEGPRGMDTAFTRDKTVYVPKHHIHPIAAISNFLYELTNGINSSSYMAIHKKADEGKITAKMYALEKTKIEAEAGISAAKIWCQMKENCVNPRNLDQYDKFFGMNFIAYNKEEMSYDDLINNMLKVPLDGVLTGMTFEEFYINQYEQTIETLKKLQLY